MDQTRTDYEDSQRIFTRLPYRLDGEAVEDGTTECLISGWFKRKIMSTPGFPSPIVHPPRVVYEIRQVADRGLGVFAAQNIEAGDLIIAERPLMVRAAWNAATARSDLSQEEKLRAVGDQLQPQTKR